MGVRMTIGGICALALGLLQGCGSVEEATAQTQELSVIDYHVSYGPVDDVAGDVRNLVGAGWQPLGPIQLFDCGPAPALCGVQTVVLRAP